MYLFVTVNDTAQTVHSQSLHCCATHPIILSVCLALGKALESPEWLLAQLVGPQLGLLVLVAAAQNGSMAQLAVMPPQPPPPPPEWLLAPQRPPLLLLMRRRLTTPRGADALPAMSQRTPVPSTRVVVCQRLESLDLWWRPSTVMFQRWPRWLLESQLDQLVAVAAATAAAAAPLPLADRLLDGLMPTSNCKGDEVVVVAVHSEQVAE